jgi:hypothetical protein
MSCIVLGELACHVSYGRKGGSDDQLDSMMSAAVRAMGGGVCIGR